MQESYSRGKKVKFLHLLTVRLGVVTPHPPLRLTVSLSFFVASQVSANMCIFLSFWCFMIFEANASDWTWHQADAQGRKAGGVIRGYLAASFEINTQMIFN